MLKVLRKAGKYPRSIDKAIKRGGGAAKIKS